MSEQGGTEEGSSSGRPQPVFFISHSSKDGDLARKLTELLKYIFGLEAKDILCTSDPEYGLEAGQYPERIKEALKNCLCLFGLFTPNAISAPWVWTECGAAWMADSNKLLPLFSSKQLRKDTLAYIRDASGVTAEDEDPVLNFHSLLEKLSERHKIRMIGNLIYKRREIDQLFKLLGSVPLSRSFCELGQFFDRERQNLNSGPLAQGGDLFHAYINLEKNAQLASIKVSVADFFRILDPGSVSEAVLWSLLGSMELAVTFRSSQNDSQKIEKGLRMHLRKSALYGSQSDAFFEENLQVRPLWLREEYVWRSGEFMQGRGSQPDFDLEKRTTHAFIRLELDEDFLSQKDDYFEKLQQGLKDVNNSISGAIHVDSYARSSCGRYVVIEIHAPCGRHLSIKTLSSELEPMLVYWNKETFIAYDQSALPIRGSQSRR